MSLFQDYKRNFQRNESVSSDETQQPNKSYLLDSEYVEKCASALEFLAESGYSPHSKGPAQGSTPSPADSFAIRQGIGEKLANLATIKKLVAQGMPLEAAARKAYPDYTDDQIKELVASMGKGMPASAPKEVPPKEVNETREEFRAEEGSKEKQAAFEQAADDTLQEDGTLLKLRNRIKEKLADKQSRLNEGSEEHLNNILSRISGLHEQFVVEDAQEDSPEEVSPQAQLTENVEDAELSATADSQLTTPSEDESAGGGTETETSEGSESGLASRLRERLQARQEGM